MSTITKEQAKDLRNAFQCWQQDYDPVEDKEQYDMFGLGMVAMDALLASLEAEPVGWLYSASFERGHVEGELTDAPGCDMPVYTAPPAPVSVPEWTNEQCMEFLSIAFRHAEINGDLELDDIRLGVKMVNDSRAAMLQGTDTELQRKAAIHDALCQKYNVESLDDFVDWQRNHIAELEAAPPTPVGPGETAVMPDYPGYTMTQRECYQAGKKAGLAELVTTSYKLPANVIDALEKALEAMSFMGDTLNAMDAVCEEDVEYVTPAFEAVRSALNGNSPVIPDGWVACCERMPETDGNYWGWWSESKRQGPAWFIKSELQAQFQSSEITHWMPLPAAPQQEVK
ncbi:DUF551 domain-containing protein [Enterobacter sichuanensis]|uniref:DUF551 domain-containing protein n=1 Tax=Enterobacter sichuanensis TaxID=2071710 RepID=UPI00217E896E|nr:DUF551 domain-containing protein [Enterobacter sichuanensis]